MPSFYESPATLRASRHFDGVARVLITFFPNMEWDLKRAGMSIDVIRYLSVTVYLTVVAFILTSLAMSAPLLGKYSAGKRVEYGDIIFSVVFVGVITGLTFLYLIFQPKIKIAKRARQIDNHLEYMLKDMQVQLSAGIPLFDTIVNIARGQYGECSLIAEGIVQEVQSGRSVVDVLDDVGMWSPSNFLRKVLWQIVNAVRSGADVVKALEAISNDIRVEKENKIKSYGQEMNLWGLIYLMAAVIVPSMGVTLLVILSSFLGEAKIDKSMFIGILVGLFIFQVIFLSFVSSKRPDIG